MSLNSDIPSRPQLRAFQRAFLASVAITLLFGFWATRKFHASVSQPVTSLQSIAPLTDLRRNGLIASGITPTLAKFLHRAWLYRSGDAETGLGVNVLSSPVLFQQLFPGYPEAMRLDGDLWARYFSHRFNSDVRIPALGASAETFVSTPWMGCLDIFGKYGADVLILGDSEVSRSLYPFKIAGAFGKGTRVLACTRDGMTPMALKQVVEILHERIQTGKSHPVARIILGFSLRWIDSPSHWTTDLAEEEEIKLARNILAFEPKLLIGKMDWKNLLPLTLDDLFSAQRAPDYYASNDFIRKATVTYPYSATLPQARIPHLPEVINELAPYYHKIKLGGDLNCHNELGITAPFRELVSKLLTVGERVYVYRNPVTSFRVDEYPSCIATLIGRMFASVTSNRLFTRNESWESYGLEWKDFVLPLPDPNIVSLNLNHTNYLGANKVNQVIGDWIRREEGK